MSFVYAHYDIRKLENKKREQMEESAFTHCYKKHYYCFYSAASLRISTFLDTNNYEIYV